MGRFKVEDRIFADRSVLHDTYVPETLPGRESEMEDYFYALEPIVHNDVPNNILTYGETGVGKTVATRRILDELYEDQQDIDGVNFEYVWVNCKDKTSYQVTVTLVNELREPENQISSNGYPRSRVLNMLWEAIDDLGATHVMFVLDEIDSLGADDSLMYQIPRANANGMVETQVGMIGISNNFTFRDNLSARVKSSLREEEIHFGSYNASQLRQILKQRSEIAFEDGVVEDGVIPYIAARVAQDSGSAREAIDILRVAGQTARRQDDNMVTEVHARSAVDELEELIVEKELHSLPTQSHAILQAIIMLDDRNELPARRKEIYEIYKTVSESLGISSKSSRTVHDRLSQLTLKGFLTVYERNKGEAGGKYWEYDLDITHETIDQVLDDVERLSDFRAEAK